MPAYHPSGSNPPTSTPAWAEDVNRAAQHLARLTLESAAQAALIVRNGRLWAYAGELPQPAAEELALAVASIWERNGGGDIARFVYLGAMKSDYLVYATSLATSMILTLVYDVATPFTQIRSQATRLARSLETINGESAAPEAEPEELEADEEEAIDVDEFLSRLPPLFEEAPPPPTSASAWMAEFPPAAPETATVDVPLPETEPEPAPQPEPARQPEPVPQPAIAAPVPPLPEPAFQPVFDSAPGQPIIYNLSVAVVLVPRLPKHLITGDLAANLGEWLAQLCLAFGYRLEHIAVRPDHVTWIAGTEPSTSPLKHVRNLRKHTSRLIFEEFPRLFKENPSGDFWAPGTLIMSASTPLAPGVVQNFIQQVRQAQGANRKAL